MTTADAPKQPATPYDAVIELHHQRQPSKDRAQGERLLQLENRREAYLLALADLAPLHRQLVGALDAVLPAIRWGAVHQPGNLVQWTEAEARIIAALDAARKAGLS